MESTKEIELEARVRDYTCAIFEEFEKIGKDEMEGEEAETEFLAMFLSCFTAFKVLTDNETDDLVTFTHLLNRMAFKYLYKYGREVKEND